MAKWKPIATAPKDGTHILLFCPDGINAMTTPEGMEGVKVVSGMYRGRPWDTNGYWICHAADYDFGYYPGDFDTSAAQIFPSHWQPMLESPDA